MQETIDTTDEKGVSITYISEEESEDRRKFAFQMGLIVGWFLGVCAVTILLLVV